MDPAIERPVPRLKQLLGAVTFTGWSWRMLSFRHGIVNDSDQLETGWPLAMPAVQRLPPGVAKSRTHGVGDTADTLATDVGLQLAS